MHTLKPSIPFTSHTQCGQQLRLFAEKALYWQEEESLLLADLHLGKAEHFRKAGIPVPARVHHHDLQRLQALILFTQAKKVYFLGDLFHSHLNSAWPTLISWMESLPEIDFILIKGNHDILPEQAYRESPLQIIPLELAIPPFLLTHEPFTQRKEKSGLYPICGHIHPAVSLKGSAFQQITLPCFYFGLHYAILPAFGKFTGFHKIKPDKGMPVFVITENHVLRI